ncbi:MAG TPA: PAS domain S-box protein [Methanocella sp.]|nr:PAS domain S-box protein [Methanocella sp.]
MPVECVGDVDLRAAYAKYKLFFDCAQDMTFFVDLTGKILDANQKAIEGYGYSLKEFQSMNIRDLRTPSERKGADKILKEAFEKGTTYETVHQRKSGREFPVEISSRGIKLDGLEVMLSIARDITARKATERSVARLAAIVESSDDAVLGMTPDGIITEWNHGAEAIYHYKAREILGRSVCILIPKDHDGELSHIIDTIRQGERLEHFDTVRLRKDGTRVHVSLTASPIRGTKGELLGISWAARDITEGKRDEEALEKAKSRSEMYLDLMGHDINNMNQIAMGYQGMALVKFQHSDEEQHLLENVLAALKNSALLIGNVRKIQKIESGEIKNQKINLCSALIEVAAEYSRIPNRRVTINYKPTPECYIIANDLLKDVFSNLIGNAIKHSNPEKPLTINMSIDDVMDGDKPYYKIIIEDDGPGIPDQQKNRLFQRFQRGETTVSGKGLGLYIVRMLVEDFNGRVRVEDRVPGDHTKGAKFVIMLPAME